MTESSKPGLYMTAGTIITLPDGQHAKARDLSGQSGLLFRRNSITGPVEAITRPGTWGSPVTTFTPASNASTSQLSGLS